MNFNKLDRNEKYLNGRISFIFHKDQYILFTDYSNLEGSEMEIFAQKVYDWCASFEYTDKNSLLNFSDFTNSKVSKKALNILNGIGKDIMGPYNKKSALIGINRMQKIFLNTLNKISGANILCFNTKEDALDWLGS